MKDFFKNKKASIVLITILLIGIIGISCFFFFGRKGEESSNKNLKEGEYVLYVKINPLVKLTFKSSYYECKNKNGEIELCEKYTNEVVNAEFLNDDAESIYKEINFKGKDLNDVLVTLVKTAEEKDFDVTNIDFTTNWNYIDSISKDIEKQIKEETSVSVEIKFNYEEHIDEDKILENEKIKSYTVTFNTDGGTNVANKKVKENEKVAEPQAPTKDGYTFIGWYLNDKKYDFNSSITGNLTLKARWKKESKDNKENTNKENTNKENTNKENTNKSLSQKEKDNETLKKQLKEKGLVWDTNTYEEACSILDKWAAAGGFAGDIIESSYGESDIAYTVKITLDTSLCGGNEILNINWRNSSPVDFVYYLHSKGYNCSGNIGYHNGKHFHINDNNELIYDE